jgi:hypothetical protein
MKRWRIVPLLMVFVALAHFNRVSIAVAGAEQIIRPGFITETEMGVVYSSFLLLYTIFMIPGGGGFYRTFCLMNSWLRVHGFFVYFLLWRCYKGTILADALGQLRVLCGDSLSSLLCSVS